MNASSTDSGQAPGAGTRGSFPRLLQKPVNPFRLPRPATEYQPYLAHGDDTVYRRTPQAAHEAMQRRVQRWFQSAHDALPPNISRDDMIATVYGTRGWRVRASLATIHDNRWPAHGWVLTHPTDGIVIYVDKARNGDLGPDYVAPSTGIYGACPRMEWAGDLTEFLVRSVGPEPTLVRFPQLRSTLHLLAAAYHAARAEEQGAAAFMVALNGGNLPRFLEVFTHDDMRYAKDVHLRT